jgi:hypothetical protein
VVVGWSKSPQGNEQESWEGYGVNPQKCHLRTKEVLGVPRVREK